MTKWTEGEWSRGFDYFEEARVDFEGSGHYITLSVPGRKLPIAFVIGTPGKACHDDPEQEANARLIAAAPELYEALSDVRKAIASLDEYALGGVTYEDGYGGFTQHGIRDEMLAKIDAALSRASDTREDQ